MRKGYTNILRDEREILIILNAVLKIPEGITYKHLGRDLYNQRIDYLREKIKVLILDGFIKETGNYNKILSIPEELKKIILERDKANKKALELINQMSLLNVARDREKDRKKIYSNL